MSFSRWGGEGSEWFGAAIYRQRLTFKETLSGHSIQEQTSL